MSAVLDTHVLDTVDALKPRQSQSFVGKPLIRRYKTLKKQSIDLLNSSGILPHPLYIVTWTKINVASW